MAKPDLENGWLRYAHELDAALAVAGFTSGARIVLHEVFAQVFGPARLKTAGLSPSDIAARVGLHRQYLVRAIRELIDSAVLVRLDDGRFRFVKDYESWMGADRSGSTGKPRLTAKQCTYCREATATAMAYRDGIEADSDLPERNQMVSPPKPDGFTRRNQMVSESETKSFHPTSRNESPPYHPLVNEGAPARAEFKTSKTKDSVTTTPCVSPRGHAPARATGRRGGGLKQPGSITFEELLAEAACMHSATVAAAVEANRADILAAFPDRLDCYRDALREAATERSVIRSAHHWCMAIAGQIRDGTYIPRAAILPHPAKAAVSGGIDLAEFLANDPECQRIMEMHGG